MNAKGIIFDFNGTLFFDYNENYDAWQAMAEKYRGYRFSEEEFLSMMGKTDRTCAKYIIQTEEEKVLDELSEEKENLYKALCIERQLDLEPYAVKFLNYAKGLGLRLMIASSAPKMNMDFYIEALKLERFFDTEDIVAGRDDIASKPSPDIYLYTQKLGGLKGSECLCFEDAPAGLQAANGAGFAKVFAIESPGLDWNVTGKLAPLKSWEWIYNHREEILSL